jgi:acyl dehydratase
MIERRYLEDLAVGEIKPTREIAVSEADILEFARQYDPQDMHTGAQASSSGAFDGLIASGWHCGAGHATSGGLEPPRRYATAWFGR